MPGPPPSKAPKGSFGDVSKSPNLSPALPSVPASSIAPLALLPAPISPSLSPRPAAKLDDEKEVSVDASLSGILKKKSQKNRHLWNARYVELRGRDLVFFRSKADAAINKGPVVALFEDMIQVEIPKVGRGVDDSTRFNIRLHSLNAIVSASPWKTMREGLLELQAPDPKSCLQWTQALQALGVKVTEGPLPSDMLPEATETVSPEAKAQLLLRFGGHLKKKSRKMRGIWVSRYVVVSEKRMSYYRAEEDARDEINPTHVLWSDIVSVTLLPGPNGQSDPTRFSMVIRDHEPIEWQAAKDDCRGWMVVFEKKVGGKPNGSSGSEPALPPRPKPKNLDVSAASKPVSSSPLSPKASASSKPSPSPSPSAAPSSTKAVSSVPKVIEAASKPAPLPTKPVVTPVISSPPAKPVESKAADQPERLRELLRVGGPVRKKGVQYPHNWHPRHMIIVDEQLCYYANAADCTSNTNAKVVPLFDILSLKVPTRGKGAAEGLRFNMEMVGSSLLEWQALTKETTQDWVALFAKYGITETSSAARQQARKGDTPKVDKPDKVLDKAKDEKHAEVKAEKPVYQPAKSRTGVYTIKPVIGLRVVTHENKGVLVAAITAEPAEKAGLRKGDVVKSVNGSVIKCEEDCLSVLKSAHIGDELVFRVQRGGTDVTCTVTVGMKEPDAKSKLIPKALRAALEPAAPAKPISKPSDEKQCGLCERKGHTSRDHECGGCRATGLHRGRYCPSCPPAVGLSWDESPEGCTITVLDTGCAAEISGLRSGDVLEKIENLGIRTGTDIRKAMEGVKPGQTLEFKIKRAGKHEVIHVKVLAKRNKKFAVKNLVDGVKQVKTQIAR